VLILFNGLPITYNDSSICDGRILVFRYACTEVDFYFIVEDTFCHLTINVKPEQKLIKVPLPIAPMSSPAIANTFVVRSCLHTMKADGKNGWL
jgi:hypothetical protein